MIEASPEFADFQWPGDVSCLGENRTWLHRRSQPHHCRLRVMAPNADGHWCRFAYGKLPRVAQSLALVPSAPLVASKGIRGVSASP